MGWLSALFKGLSKSAVKSAARKAAPTIAKTVAKNALAGATQYGTNQLMSSVLGGSGRRRRHRRRRAGGRRISRRGRIRGRGFFGDVWKAFRHGMSGGDYPAPKGMHGHGRRRRIHGRGKKDVTWWDGIGFM